MVHRVKDTVNTHVGNGLLHLGWALWGQGCDCGTFPSFNWLAHTINFLRLDTSEVLFDVGKRITDYASVNYEEYL